MLYRLLFLLSAGKTALASVTAFGLSFLLTQKPVRLILFLSRLQQFLILFAFFIDEVFDDVEEVLSPAAR